ncbi:hypothetical protein J1P26_21945 [Neobacillus sp. MM2021_6]|uniref:hypothetical protein n=1 Tax=Bacillaceae TaxID=186817 RepID=UPI001A943B8A|nr:MULTISPECIES: hypothetical protein [Bacillaceae]MBO0962370.1 hypothetical protein [Neobacillus sp. MM2021_6]
MQGYIKDFRKELGSAIWMMPPLYHRIWQYLKYTVNHQDNTIPMRDGTFLTIKAGQHLTSVREVAKKVGWYEGVKYKEPNPKTVTTILEWMEKQSMIRIDRGKGNRQYTLITLLNWDLYQVKSVEGNTTETPRGNQNEYRGNRQGTGSNQSYQGIQEPNGVEGNSQGTVGEHLADINKNDKECLKNDLFIAADDNTHEEIDGVPTTGPQGDPVPSGEISQTSEDAAKILIDRFIQLRAYGFSSSPVDESAAKEIIAGGVPIADALVYLKECFDNYIPKHSRDRINSLSYCAGPILDKHHRKLESINPAKKQPARKGAYKRPIRQEIVPEYFTDDPSKTTTPQLSEEEAANRQRAIQEKLNRFRAL